MENTTDRILEAFKSMDDATSSTGKIRDKLISKLETAFDRFDFDIEKSSPEERESAMSVINALDGLLKGKEKVALDNVKVSLSQRKDDDDHDRSELVAEALKQISPILAMGTGNQEGKTFDSKTIELDVEIRKEELEIDE